MASRKGSAHAVRCPLLSVDEAAARLGCSPMDLWRLIHAGECPGMVQFSRYFVEEAALDLILDRLTAPEVK